MSSPSFFLNGENTGFAGTSNAAFMSASVSFSGLPIAFDSAIMISLCCLDSPKGSPCGLAASRRTHVNHVQDRRKGNKIMNKPYNSKEVISSIQDSYLSMCSALAFDCYMNKDGACIYNSLTDIEVDSYLLSKELQKISLSKAPLARFAISSAMRGVFSAMYEGLNNNVDFRDKIKDILYLQYDNFFALVNLLRNLYSHEITWTNSGSIILKKSDFTGFMNWRNKKKLPKEITLNVCCRDIFPAIKPPENRRVQILLDTYLLKEGEKLANVLTQFDQFMLAELCFNLCNEI